MWCILSNKVPTEINLMKWDFQGPSRCCLYKCNVEDTDHLFLHCSVTTQFWSAIISSLNLKRKWDGQNIEEAWSQWWLEAPLKKLGTFPLLSVGAFS